MTHHPDRESLSAYVDGELIAEERGQIERHARECDACSEAIRSMRALKHAVGNLPASAATSHALRARLEGLDRQQRARRRTRMRGAWAAAAIAAVACAAIWATSEQSLSADALVADHLHSIPAKRPPQVSSRDPNAVARFFAGRLPFAPVTPRLPDAELLGGRLCTLRGHVLQLLFYEKEKHTLSLFVSRTATVDDGCVSRLGHRVCQRRSGDLRLILVGDLPAPEMNTLLQRAEL